MKVSPAVRQVTGMLDNLHMSTNFAKYGGQAAQSYVASEKTNPDQAAQQYKAYLDTIKSLSSPASQVKNAVSQIVGGQQ